MELISFLANACSYTTGGKTVTVDGQLVGIIQLVYKAIQIGVPLILIFVGMLDMGKAITQQKEDEIKKAQSLLVKKAIAAALVFLMFGIVKLVIGVVNNNDQGTLNFVDCLLTGEGSAPTQGGGGTSVGTCTASSEGVVGENNCANGKTPTVNGTSCVCQ